MISQQDRNGPISHGAILVEMSTLLPEPMRLESNSTDSGWARVEDNVRLPLMLAADTSEPRPEFPPPVDLRGLHPDNPVNRTRAGGVQLELPPRVRGHSPVWADWAGPGPVPPMAALIETLAGWARSPRRSRTVVPPADGEGGARPAARRPT